MPINIDHTGNLILTSDGLLSFDMTGSVRLPTGTQAQRPSVPTNGMIRYSTTANNFEGYINGAWQTIGSGGGGGASVTVSDTPPLSPATGDLWFDSDDATLYVWYDDGDSTQWVDTTGGGGAGSGAFIDNGSYVFYNGGLNVGIGTNIPDFPLEVVGGLKVTADTSLAHTTIRARASDSISDLLVTDSAGNAAWNWRLRMQTTSSGVVQFRHNDVSLFQLASTGTLTLSGSSGSMVTGTGGMVSYGEIQARRTASNPSLGFRADAGTLHAAVYLNRGAADVDRPGKITFNLYDPDGTDARVVGVFEDSIAKGGTLAGISSIVTREHGDVRYVQAATFNESVDDRVANLIVGGVGITTTYDDGANTLTIDGEDPIGLIIALG